MKGLLVNTDETEEFCLGCVYYPPNLPPHAYPREDWLMLQKKSCSFDFRANDANCKLARKTSCSIVDLNNLSGAGNTTEDK